MENFWNIVRNISAFVGCLTGVAAATGIVVKPARSWFVRKVSRISQTEENRQRDEKALNAIQALGRQLEEKAVRDEQIYATLKDILRNNITHIYYKYRHTKQIPLFERQNLIAQYDSYAGLGGNNYVTHLYAEMCSWETVE